jgi:hypothetical protein
MQNQIHVSAFNEFNVKIVGTKLAFVNLSEDFDDSKVLKVQLVVAMYFQVCRTRR